MLTYTRTVRGKLSEKSHDNSVPHVTYDFRRAHVSSFSPWRQILKEMQDEQRAIKSPAELQAQAHAAAVKRFTGGGFAVN